MPADDRDPGAPRQPPAAGYDVGYGKPPKATRFQPGTSGNPRGRPRGSRNRSPSAASMQRMQAIVLQEAYRLVTVRDGDRPVDVPLFQAAMRSLAVNAAKGQDIASYAMDLMDMGGIVMDHKWAPMRAAFQESLLSSPGSRIAAGTDEILRNIIAERVLGLPGDVRVDRELPFEELPTSKR